MPVAVRLIEVLAIIALVATMAAGTAIVIFMEKCLAFLLIVTTPLVYIITFFLGLLKYTFLNFQNLNACLLCQVQRLPLLYLNHLSRVCRIGPSVIAMGVDIRIQEVCSEKKTLKHLNHKLMYKLAYLMQNLARALWDTSQTAGKCAT